MKMTRGEMQDLLAKFSAGNPTYRTALLKNPKGVVSKQFAITLPDNLNVKVVEESAHTIYIVLPHVVAAGAELADSDLEMVAGGFLDKTANCDEGILSTVVSINASLF